MTQQLLSALYGKWDGKPILVIGGGPSVPGDLKRLVELGVKPACVISANDHGAHQTVFDVDLFVNVDKIHCLKRIPMQTLLRPFGKPIVNRHSWADYRLVDWTFSGNTGLTSIAIAATLGGNPVLVTGIDMWHGGRLYFHETPPPANPRARAIKPSVTRRDREAMRPLAAFVAGANIRPISGPLCDFFPRFDPAAPLPLTRPVLYRAKTQALKPVMIEAIRPFHFATSDPVSKGDRVVVSQAEAERLAHQQRPLAKIV